MQPHRHRYWLNAQPSDPAQFKQQVLQVCQLYKEAIQLQAQGVHIVSTDEMTGIQAIERAYPTSAMTLGEVDRVEFEYIRHGTLRRIGNWDVAALASADSLDRFDS